MKGVKISESHVKKIHERASDFDVLSPNTPTHFCRSATPHSITKHKHTLLLYGSFNHKLVLLILVAEQEKQGHSHPCLRSFYSRYQHKTRNYESTAEVTTPGPAVHLFFFMNRSSIFDGFLC